MTNLLTLYTGVHIIIHNRLVNAGNTQMEGGVSETVIDVAEEDLSNHVASIS